MTPRTLRAPRTASRDRLLKAAEAARDFIGTFRAYSKKRRRISCSGCTPLDYDCGVEENYQALTKAIQHARRKV